MLALAQIVRGIAYLELFVEDPETAVAYLTASLGFTEAANSRQADRNSTLLQAGSARLVVTSGPATEEYLATHGDGVADVAFACAAPAASRRRALDAGATALDEAAVSGIGGLRHTLVPYRDGADLRPDRPWVPASPVRAPEPSRRILGLDHLAICVEPRTLDETTRFYEQGFGLGRYFSEYVEVGDQAMDSTVVRDESGAVTFTLLEPDDTKSPGQINTFLERNAGPGVQHIALLVDDIVAAVRELRSRDVEFLRTPDTYYQRLVERGIDLGPGVADLREANVLVDRDEWGHLLQLFTRSPYRRGTLFYELIQRQGAKGFGSANIRALYEAVQRERIRADAP